MHKDPEQRKEYDKHRRANRTPETVIKDRERNRLKSKARYYSHVAILDEIRANSPCSCGESDPACLDFHHTDADKDFAVTLAATRSKARFMAEIAKCIVICANCHRKLHAKL